MEKWINAIVGLSSVRGKDTKSTIDDINFVIDKCLKDLEESKKTKSFVKF
ncbi:hypothetical protein [Candidatus Thioglobus sp.]|nr:hypothetical protein [Candidatus Thioglobus sp.]MDG2395720.1 hypothetical protein [Candidatus Thioglobus sp.]